MSTTIYDMTAHDLRDQIVGQTVVEVSPKDSTITLANGTVLYFEGASECCAWFTAELEQGNLTDNRVTHIEEVPLSDDKYGEGFKLHILATDTRIATVTIDGTSTSGYYCLGITLNVHTKGDAR